MKYAGGGGGGSEKYTNTNPGLGTAGGGNGSVRTDTGSAGNPGTSGLANTGGGGGGCSNYVHPSAGAGGSGIVVIRYPAYLAQASSTTGSPTYYQSVGYNVYVFNASGTITF